MIEGFQGFLAELLKEPQACVQAKSIATALIKPFGDLVDVGADFIEFTSDGGQFADNVAQQHNIAAGAAGNPHAFDLAENLEPQQG